MTSIFILKKSKSVLNGGGDGGICEALRGVFPPLNASIAINICVLLTIAFLAIILIPALTFAEGGRFIKGNFTKSIEELKKSIPATCENHGDIDCSKGSDVDDSVICADGFKDSKQFFIESCTNKILKGVLTIKMQNGEEQRGISSFALRNLKPSEIKFVSLSVRNMGGLEIKNIAFSFYMDSDHIISLSGPNELTPFGGADYEAEIKGAEDILLGVFDPKIIDECERCNFTLKTK